MIFFAPLVPKRSLRYGIKISLRNLVGSRLGQPLIEVYHFFRNIIGQRPNTATAFAAKLVSPIFASRYLDEGSEITKIGIPVFID